MPGSYYYYQSRKCKQVGQRWGDLIAMKEYLMGLRENFFVEQMLEFQVQNIIWGREQSVLS